MPELVAPDVRFRRSFAAAMAEFRAEGRGGPDDRSVIGRYLRDHAGAPADDAAFGAFVDGILADRLDETPRPAGFVPGTELWWAEGDEFLGRIGVRHRLTPELLEVGGHIGYDVRPSARRRGYATAMLRRALAVARELGIDSALVTCDAGNTASQTVIERNGGVLEDERRGKLRYWVPTGQERRTPSGLTDHEGREIDFGRTAADYERYRPGFPASLFDRLERLRWIEPGMRALDLGTGTGALALAFAERGLRVTGLDLSPDLLGVARRVAADRGLDATFRQGRAEDTGLPGGSFDLVTAGQCWWWFDSDLAAREAVRLLAPGGRLLICDFSYLLLPGNVCTRSEELVIEHNPGWPMAGWRGIHPEQVEALDVAGFRQVESFSYTVDVPFSHEAWRGRMRTCNGIGTSLEPAQVDAFDRDLAALLASEYPGELSVPHRVFAVSGLRPRRAGA